jgi:hypothetical protein
MVSLNYLHSQNIYHVNDVLDLLLSVMDGWTYNLADKISPLNSPCSDPFNEKKGNPGGWKHPKIKLTPYTAEGPLI